METEITLITICGYSLFYKVITSPKLNDDFPFLPQFKKILSDVAIKLYRRQITVVVSIVTATAVTATAATIPYLVGGGTKYSVVTRWKQKLSIFSKSISVL